MAQNKIFNYEPFVISSSVLATLGGIVFNCLATPAFVGLAAAAPYAVIKHVRVNNLLTTTAITVSLYKSTLATGIALNTQSWVYASVSIPASSYVEEYCQARFDSTDYLLAQAWGLTSYAANIQLDGEIGIA